MSTSIRPRSLVTRINGLVHGCDWFPEQWLHDPTVIDEDVRLMKQAGINAVSVGMFAWSALEPREGTYCFDWLDGIMDRLAENGISALLATPTGARPAWMSQAYPEVLRVNAERHRNLHGFRHNHCYSSPLYRQKSAAINRRLAQRYGAHPALLTWHVSNEYGGECHCELCQEAFRQWLRRRYHGDLAALNDAWWAAFWSHTFTDWRQVESPSPRGEPQLPGLTLDWKRFVTDQTVDFMLGEIAPLKEAAPNVPLTTNMMGTYPGLDYRKFAPHIDVASWNSYPSWHGTGPLFDGGFPWDPRGRDWRIAADTAFTHDLMRSLKGGQPFLLMESTPTFSNWHAVWKPKRPGVHALSSLLAVAHGADSVQYFQWRASPGGTEQFHGAVVGHAGPEANRVFGEVSALGRLIEQLRAVAGTTVSVETAIVFEWENRWALETAGLAPAAGSGGCVAACARHHFPLWAMGIPVDVIDMERGLSPYRLVVAPMLAMIKPGFVERLEAFVRAGGTAVLTCRSGILDEHGRCFRGGFPGPLRSLLGVVIEETDGLYPEERNAIVAAPRNGAGLKGAYEVRGTCDVLRPEGARVIATYRDDFYRGRPALTAHSLGDGRALYIGADADERFLADFYRGAAARLGLRRATSSPLPEGVGAQVRTDGSREYMFLLNFSPKRRTVVLDRREYRDIAAGKRTARHIALDGYGYRVLESGHG